MSLSESDSKDKQSSNQPSQQSQQSQHSKQSQQPEQQQQQQQQSSQNQDQNVTVETETVPTVATLGVLASAVNPSGALRIKRSQDSVPRISARGKKRSQRLAQGSKADIFAAKVANAVDEHDSSGSDETFVYDMPQSHANDSIRKPLPRTYSHTGSVAGVNEDEYVYDSESDIEPLSGGTNGGHGHGIGHGPGHGPGGSNLGSSTSSLNVNTGNTAGGSTPSLGPISPKKADQIPPRSPRNFVVPNRARRTNSSTFIPTTTHEYPENSDHHTVEPLSSNASGTVPLTSPFMEIDNPYEDTRMSNWGRHSRKNSRSRPSGEKPGSNSISNTTSLTSRDPNDSIRAKNSYLQRWRTPAHLSQFSDGTQSESDERTNLLKARPSLYNYQSSKNSQGRRMRQLSQGAVPFAENNHLGSNQLGSSYGGGYNSIREQQQQPPSYSDNDLGHQSDSSYDAVYAANTSTPMRFVLMAILLLVMLLFVVFIVGGFLAAKRPLEDFDLISLADVFVSDRELVFSLISHARNPGLLSVTINKCNLDIFATSAYAKGIGSSNADGDDNDDINTLEAHKKRAPRAVFLGTIKELESPITFHGGLSSASQWRSTAVKLVEPLANNTKEWTQISAHEFDLTVKGTLSYDIFWSENIETVSRAYHVVAPEFLDGIHAML